VIYGASYLNLRGLGTYFGGAEPLKAPHGYGTG